MIVSGAVELVWRLAAAEAESGRHEHIEPEHFLCGLTKLSELAAPDVTELMKPRTVDLARILKEAAPILALLSNPSEIRHELRKRLGRGTFVRPEGAHVPRSVRSRRMFLDAEGLAKEAGADELQLAHLLGAMRRVEDSPLARYLSDSPPASSTPAPPSSRPPADVASRPTPALDRFGRDLTKLARAGRLPPVIGRRREMRQVLQTLARLSKNNPVLVGEPGVGKTAIAEALAMRIAEGKDPHVLEGRRLIELPMAELVAGAGVVGEFESRLRSIVRECREHPEVILFIDELHLVMSARGAGANAADILKPALARGELRCMGATTLAEYARHIEADAALARRFEKILVPEPSREEALEILKGLKARWERHHGVVIPDETLEAAVELSILFDGERQLPDKAIDLVDRAGARVRVPDLSLREEQEEQAEVSSRDVATVLAERLGVPLESVTGYLEGVSESRLLQLQEFLGTQIVGQAEAIERVCQRLIAAYAGLRRRRRPLAVYLFLGPTGVGKTELAYVLTEFLFGERSKLIRFDMSEYAEPHNVARLIGAPPGYLGHDEDGQLTSRIRAQPHSVVLLDEIEKADPRVFDVFLQLFDAGRLTDAKGRTADARHVIFILTSNIQPERGFGFHAAEDDALLRSLRAHLRPELINRIDEVILFEPLGRDGVLEILRRTLACLRKEFEQRHDKLLHFTDGAVELLVTESYRPEFGAREVRRVCERLVEAPLGRLLVAGEAAEWPGILVGVRDGELVFERGETMRLS